MEATGARFCKSCSNVKYFAVVRERGPAWDVARAMTEQECWPEHAAFMNALAEDGFVILGGPLGDGRILLIINADSEDVIRDRLAADPWVPMDLLRIAAIDSWQLLLGKPPSPDPAPDYQGYG